MELLMTGFLLLVLNFGLILGQTPTTPTPELTIPIGNLQTYIKAEITRQMKEVTEDVINHAVEEKVREVNNELVKNEVMKQINQANNEIIKQEVTKQVQETNNELIKDEVSKQVKERANQHISDGVTKLDLLADRLQPLKRLADGVQQMVKEQTTRGNI